MGCAQRGYSWAVVVVPIFAWLSSTLSTDYSRDYQRFVDFYPIHRSCQAPLCTTFHGPRRAEATPALIDRFDWIVGHQGLGNDGHALPRRRRGDDPRTVFASPDKVQKVLEHAVRSFSPSRRDRVLVLSGAPELTASEALCGSSGQAVNMSACKATITKLQAYFRAIFFEGKDLEIEGVLAYPGGLTEMYLRGGNMELASAAIAAADVTVARKPRSVLAAWGSVWSYVEHIEEGEQMAWSAGGKPWDAIKLEAGRSRRSARAWASTSAARDAGVEVRSIPSQEWWGELAKYRFLISPLGTSIYSPKTVEALLVLTVPIVRRGPFPVHDEMVKYGFPIAVVDEWTEITDAKLEELWKELSARLVRFRRNCLTTDAYWRLLTGVDRYCQ